MRQEEDVVDARFFIDWALGFAKYAERILSKQEQEGVIKEVSLKMVMKDQEGRVASDLMDTYEGLREFVENSNAKDEAVENLLDFSQQEINYAMSSQQEH